MAHQGHTASDGTQGPVASRRPSVRLLMIQDITGSMEGQLGACKSYTAQTAMLCAQLDEPISMAVVTFTEGRRGCYVSLDEFTDLQAASTFVQSLRLCRPPQEPSSIANGGDGPENHKAALHRLTDLDPSIPTIAFLITDAPPHLHDDLHGEEAQLEMSWLLHRGVAADVASDVHKVFSKVLDHFQGRMVLNVVPYGNSCDYRSVRTLYGCLAQRTGGMLLSPDSASPSVLANGLLAVIKALMHPSTQAAEQQNALEGFTVYDLSTLEPVGSEQEPLGRVEPGDAVAIFEIAMQRMAAVCGRKWAKRAKGMSAPAEQLEFVWRAARYIAAPPTPQEERDAELATLLQLRTRILELLPEEDRGHFSISDNDLQRLAGWYGALKAKQGAGGGAEEAVSAISLASVQDGLLDEPSWEDWLAGVMKVLLGYPLRVQLPLDRDGQPDFMDAWSSRLQALGCDRLSAADFMQLVGGEAAAKGPSDRQQYNAFLVTASPADPLTSLVLRLASGTQVLNYVTGVALGADGFLPNLYPGVVAATLVQLLEQKQLSGFQWQQAQELLHCLATLHHAPSPALLRELKAGRANPEDPVSKFLAAAVRLWSRSAAAPARGDLGDSQQELGKVLQLLLQEWLAATIHRAVGKRDEQGNAAYDALLQTYFPAAAVLQLPAAMDPLQQLHPLELPEKEAPAALKPGWQQALLQRLLRGDSSDSKVPPLKPVQRFESAAKRLLSLLLGKDHLEELPPVAQAWPGWEDAVVSAVLLRLRTVRYTSQQEEVAGSPTTVWTAAEVPAVEQLVLQRLTQQHAADLKGWRAARSENAAQQLLEAAAAVLMQHAGDAQAMNQGLAQLYVQLVPDSSTARPAAVAGAPRPEEAPRGPYATFLQQSVRLERVAADDLLPLLGPKGPTPEQLQVLVTGDWSTQPASALRRSVAVQAAVAAVSQGLMQELSDAIKARDSCARTSRINQHGHTAELQYPGPDGWTPEYAAKRLELLKGKRLKKANHYLAAMQKFTAMARWARQEAAAAEVAHSNCQQAAAVEAVLVGLVDANLLKNVLPLLEEALGKKLQL